MNKTITTSLSLLKDLSNLFEKGLTRINPSSTTLDQLIDIFQGSPLYDVFNVNIKPIIKGQPTTKAIQFLGMAIATLDATIADGIQSEYSLSSNFTANISENISHRDVDSDALNGFLSFLVELALQGFDTISSDEIDSVDSLLAQLEQNDDYQRIIFLIRGLVDEIIDAIRSNQHFKNYKLRWMLLWSRAVLLTYMIPEQQGQPVEGTFTPLGVDIKAQEHIVSIMIPGVLTIDDSNLFVTTQFSTYTIPELNIASIIEIIENQYPSFRSIYENLSGSSINIAGILSDGILLVDTISGNIARKKISSNIAWKRSTALNSSLLWLEIPELRDSNDNIMKTLNDKNTRFQFGYNTWNLEKESLEFRVLGIIQSTKLEFSQIPPMTDLVNDNTISLLRERASKLLREKN